jgi:hypothetical protein
MAAGGRSHGTARLIDTEIHVQAFDPVLMLVVHRLAFDTFDLQICVHYHDEIAPVWLDYLVGLL